jgi:hypothetical protein
MHYSPRWLRSVLLVVLAVFAAAGVDRGPSCEPEE